MCCVRPVIHFFRFFPILLPACLLLSMNEMEGNRDEWSAESLRCPLALLGFALLGSAVFLVLGSGSRREKKKGN